jgi:hypothetical protein
VKALRDRGVLDPETLLRFAAPDAIVGACRWFDDQRNVGIGMLVTVIKAGGKPGYETPRTQSRSPVDVSADYWERICESLRQLFPDLCDEMGRPHPAAILAVTHLHQKHGKGQLRKLEHGAVIRAACRRFDKKWGIGEESA